MNHIFLCLQTSNSIGFGKETERSMTMSKSVIPDIPSSHESLIKWAYEHKYSPVTSYTKAPVANRFHLQLEHTGELKDGLLSYGRNKCLPRHTMLQKVLSQFWTTDVGDCAVFTAHCKVCWLYV